MHRLLRCSLFNYYLVSQFIIQLTEASPLRTSITPAHGEQKVYRTLYVYGAIIPGAAIESIGVFNMRNFCIYHLRKRNTVVWRY